jgi:hypothetical protein
VFGPITDAMALKATSIVGATATQATIRLATPAPAGGTLVPLSSSAPAVLPKCPPSITVPAGERTATFPIASHAASTTTTITISAAFVGGADRTTSVCRAVG